jgi:hypothetical protein
LAALQEDIIRVGGVFAGLIRCQGLWLSQHPSVPRRGERKFKEDARRRLPGGWQSVAGHLRRLLLRNAYADGAVPDQQVPILFHDAKNLLLAATIL